MNDSSFDDLKVHGNVKWTAKFLIILAVLTAWGTEPGMTDSFAEHSSVSEALRAIRHAMRHWFERTTGEATLNARLAVATTDEYERSSRKKARYQPNFKDKPANGKPIVKVASSKQRKAYNALQPAA